MQCAHCVYSCTQDGDDMDFDTFKTAQDVVTRYESENNFRELIIISGGEPTVHPMFWEFVEEALRRSKWVVVLTNGKRTKDAMRLAEMAEQKLLHVKLSLDEWHEKIDDDVIARFSNQIGLKQITTVVASSLIHWGRATQLGLAPAGSGCPGANLLCEPSGELWLCAHRDVSYGTVWRPTIPARFFELRLTRGQHYCSRYSERSTGINRVLMRLELIDLQIARQCGL